jgi:ComF family protein
MQPLSTKALNHASPGAWWQSLRLLARLPWVRALPSQCAVCRSWPSQPVCAACLQRLLLPQQRCPSCALAWTAVEGGPARCPDCLRQPLPLHSCLSALDYRYPWSQLLTQLKFQQQTGWADFFADRLLAQPAAAELLAGLGTGDWLLPLPLSRERLAERGFNQSWELAKALHQRSRCPAQLSAGLLLRLRHTVPQSELKRSERLGNVKGAFAVEPLQAHLLANRHVVLVDDVMTSGASLTAAALALKKAGAGHVTGLVMARTPP